MAANYKSKYKVVQSIGRGLRKMDGKEKVTIYDVIDDLSFNKFTNYSMIHYWRRKKIYEKEGYTNLKEKKVKLTK